MDTPAAGGNARSLTSQAPPVWFATPDGFYALPLADTPAERAERAQEFVRALYVRGDESIWEPAAEYYAAMAAAMAQGGASYAAIGLFSTAGERNALEAIEERGGSPAVGSDDVVQCAFTLSVVPTPGGFGEPRQVAGVIHRSLSREESNDARPLELPCGPSVSCVTLTEFQLNPSITMDGEVHKLLTGKIQVHIPFPGAPFTAVFTLDTASTDYWAEFCDVMMTVLETATFEEPEVVSVSEAEFQQVVGGLGTDAANAAS